MNKQIPQIYSPYRSGFFYDKIIEPINDYLLKNKTAVSDFNLIKDIVDRSIDVKEDEISGNLPLPLYAGLIGTMLGIIVSLIKIGSIGLDSGTTDEIIEVLLDGVRIAMIASVLGLIFTGVNSFLFFKAKSDIESKKNDFFTFIQTELLPNITQNTTSALATLQSNLVKFNESFSTNILKFDSTIGGIQNSVDNQAEIINKLQKIDFKSMAQVAEGMGDSFDKLKVLSNYLNKVNGFIESTDSLNLTVTQQLEKVGEISRVVEAFDRNATNISQGSRYLRAYFEGVDNREDALNKRMTDFDVAVQDLMGSLHTSFMEKLQEFQNADILHSTSFENVFKSFKEQFAESFIEMNREFKDSYKEVHQDFKKLFVEIKNSSKEVFDDESNNLSAMNDKLNKLTSVVAEMARSSTPIAEFTSSIQNLEKTFGDQVETSKQLAGLLKEQGKSSEPRKVEVSREMRIILYVTSSVAVSSCVFFVLKSLNVF